MHMKYRDESFVLDKCNYFSTVQLWPRFAVLNPELWLGNFTEQEREYAVHLLNFYMYFSNDLIDMMFASGVHNISNHIRANGCENAKDKWCCFLSNTYITMVTGEEPNPADSGFIFTRRARDIARFKQENIVGHDRIRDDGSIKECFVLFVDDFVGSGNQFITTLERKDKNGAPSLREVMLNKKIVPIYCPLLCTEYGYDLITRNYPDVLVIPVHMLDSRYSVFSSKSWCWTEEIQKQGVNAIYQASMRAGLSEYPGDINYWKGYRGLGLAVSFAHGTPDATLPILTTTLGGWKPLIRTQANG